MSPIRPSAVLAAVAALCLLATACGDTESSRSGETAAGTKATSPLTACDAARRIAEEDDAYTKVVQAALSDFLADISAPDAEERFVAKLAGAVDAAGPLLVAYEDLAAAEPAVAEDVRTLARFTRDILEDLRGVRTLDEASAWSDGLTTRDGGPEAIGATFALDRWSRETCGVVIAD